MNQPDSNNNTGITFGSIEPAENETAFYRLMNDSIVAVVHTLPRSVQQDALFFLTRYGSIQFGEQFDFFRHGYFQPLWSLTTAIVARSGGIAPLQNLAAITAFTLMLHSIDDHLNDGDLAPTHLVVLLRSQLWKLLHENIAAAVSASAQSGNFCDMKILDDNNISAPEALFDRYYAAISDDTLPLSFESYCSRFVDEMATMLIAPSIAICVSGFDRESGTPLLHSLEQFGIACRLLDDLHDFDEDFDCCRHSGVYHALCERNEQTRSLWGVADQKKKLVVMLQHYRIREYLVSTMLQCLKEAASLARCASFENLALEYEELAAGLHS